MVYLGTSANAVNDLTVDLNLKLGGRPRQMARIGFALAASMTANYAYFLHLTRGSTSWNPFEGFGSPKAQ